jgi:GNAT superfamily N-acetyltransferase
VRGYYSLSAASFQRDSLPAEQAKRLPRYPVPAALLGRLAVDEGMKGKGLGAFLLMDALNRLLLATQTLAIHALAVDAKDEAAAAFYRKYGFIAFPADARRLFLPMATIRKLIGGRLGVLFRSSRIFAT